LIIAAMTLLASLIGGNYAYLKASGANRPPAPQA